MILFFDELTEPTLWLAGGKGATLARLLQAGFPVPPGFVILPEAFGEDGLKSRAWSQVQDALARLRARTGVPAVAVRSSAFLEDSAQSSFAGAFDTRLNVAGEEDLRQAILDVYLSARQQRVDSYSRARSLPTKHTVAVIVQAMVPARYSGVLFTADPVTGNRGRMRGNFTSGLGDRLVSGEVDPQDFSIEKIGERYDGPPELGRFKRELTRLATRLEQFLGSPQDIEFAIGDGRVHILQARPITSLPVHDPLTGHWNDSLLGEFLWTNTNFGEAVPDVMTPFSWSMNLLYIQVNLPVRLPGNPPISGNIGGRYYFNLSVMASIVKAVGLNPRRMLRQGEEIFGRVPENVEIPTIPIPLWTLLTDILPAMLKVRLRSHAARRSIPSFIAETPGWCAAVQKQISALQSLTDAADLWHGRLLPKLVRTFSILQSATGVLDNLAGPLRRDLERLMGAADANALLSAVNAEDHLLASLGLVMGLWQVAHGEMGREMFLARFGHRSAHEIEFSMPRPAEDPDWLDRQLATLDPAGHVPEMLARQAEEHAAAWSRLHVQHPRKARSLGRRIARFRMAERNREAVRSEAMRVSWMVRLLAVQVGRLSGLGDDVFFLYQDEFESLLRGQFQGQEHIPVRRQNYEGFRSLPPYPSIIIGAFDPLRWAADSKRQLTVFDGRQGQQAVPPIADDPNLLTGFPGAAGVVEGIAHVLKEPEESSQFQTGRILIAHTTNIGWTPLFPRAAAIVTDIGAPLSHAAIVARELGVPAVVGCGNATQRLRTGDRVRVDGGRGTVEIIRRIGETKRYPHNQ